MKKRVLTISLLIFSCIFSANAYQPLLPKISRKTKVDGPIATHKETTSGWFQDNEKTEHFYNLTPETEIKHSSIAHIDTEDKNIDAVMYNSLENFPQKDLNVFNSIEEFPMVINIKNDSGKTIYLKVDDYFINSQLITKHKEAFKKMNKYFGRWVGRTSILLAVAVLTAVYEAIKNNDDNELLITIIASSILSAPPILIANHFLLNEQYGKLRAKLFKNSQARTLMDSIKRIIKLNTAKNKIKTINDIDYYEIEGNEQFRSLTFIPKEAVENIEREENNFVPKLFYLSQDEMNILEKQVEQSSPAEEETIEAEHQNVELQAA